MLGVLGLLSKLWNIVVVLAHLNARLLISPSRDPLIDMLSSAGLALALYGVWRRRKWGAYLIFVRLAFTIVVQVFIYHSLNWRLTRGYTGRENVWADAMGAAMWLLAFWRTWG